MLNQDRLRYIGARSQPLNVAQTAGLCDFVQSLPDKQVWRHNQAGDLPHIAGQINPGMMAHLVVANAGRKRGYACIMNSMTTTPLSFDELIAKDSPLMQAWNRYLPLIMRWTWTCLLVLLSLTIDLWTALSPGGRQVVVCPAQERDISCSSANSVQMQARPAS